MENVWHTTGTVERPASRNLEYFYLRDMGQAYEALQKAQDDGRIDSRISLRVEQHPSGVRLAVSYTSHDGETKPLFFAGRSSVITIERSGRLMRWNIGHFNEMHYNSGEQPFEDDDEYNR